MKKHILFFFCLFLCLNVLGQDQEKVIELVREGIALHDEGKYQEAIDTYKKASKLNKKAAFPYAEIAYTYQILGDCKSAMKYLNKTLKLTKKGNISDLDKSAAVQAYNIKGTCLDVGGDPKKALKVYQEGISQYPDDYLLRYNIALTLYNTQQFNQSEQHIIKAIESNPTHTSSHYLLGLIKRQQDKRVQSLLSLYFFLLIEPNSNRSTEVLEVIDNMRQQNVKQTEENTFEIALDPLDANDEFAMIDVMLSLTTGAIRDVIDQEQSYQTKEQLFAEDLENFFKLLKDQKEDKEGFWWEFYADFYISLLESKNVEAYAYYISQSKGEAVQHWMEEYDYKITKLADFLSE